MDDSDADQREEHRLNPNQPVSPEELAKVRRKGWWNVRAMEQIWKGRIDVMSICALALMRRLFVLLSHAQQIGVLYWRYDADQYQTDPKFAVRVPHTLPLPSRRLLLAHATTCVQGTHSPLHSHLSTRLPQHRPSGHAAGARVRL